MSQITVTVPNWVVRRAEEISRREEIPLDQFVALAMAEKVSSLLAFDYLERRAQRGNLDRFKAALDKVPDVEPDPLDGLEDRATIESEWAAGRVAVGIAACSAGNRCDAPSRCQNLVTCCGRMGGPEPIPHPLPRP